MAKRYNYIPRESYVFKGYLKPRPGMYDFPTRFEFTQMFTERVGPFLRALDRVEDKPDERDRMCAAAMARHIKSWDIKDPDEKDVPVNPSTLLCLHPSLFNRLFAIVITGIDGIDPDPLDGDDDKNEDADTRLDASLSGITALEQKEENKEGN